MIAILEWKQSNVQQNIEQLQTPTMGVTIIKTSSLLAIYCCNITAILQQYRSYSFWQYCRNVVAILDFACKLVLPEFLQYCINSGNIAAILAILPETVYTFMHMYALMESNMFLKGLPLKYIFTSLEQYTHILLL